MNELMDKLRMFWTGEGLQRELAMLPHDLAALMAVWVPRMFKGGLAFLAIAILYRMIRGHSPKRGRHVRGTHLAHHRFVWLRRFFWIDNHKLRIGGVTYRRKLEPQHLLLSGSPGSGKSHTLYGTLDALRARRDAVLVTDIGADAFMSFAMDGDLLLNPLDARSVAWSPFAEMDKPADAERLAKSMIPDRENGSSEHEWFLYSQALIAAVLKRLYERDQATNESLIHALTLASTKELKALVQGLPAQALFHEGAEKMLASVRGIVGSHLAPYSYLPKDAGAKSWSIRRHVREGKGWLWLPYQEDQAAALRPLLSAWIGEAVNALLSLPASRKRRHWLLLDEVASLGLVQGLSDALTKGRKHGLCAILGLQSVAQLRAIYGHDGAQTLLSCLSSQLLLRSNDPETAEYASRHLGDCEIERQSVTETARQGRSVTNQLHVERLVLPSQMQSLPDRSGYLRLAGQSLVRHVRIPLIKRDSAIEAFVPRKIEAESVPVSSATKVPQPALNADAILNAGQGK